MAPSWPASALGLFQLNLYPCLSNGPSYGLIGCLFALVILVARPASGQPMGNEMAGGKRWQIAQELSQSVHGNLGCFSCHIPMEREMGKIDQVRFCGRCHQQALQAFQNDAHGKGWAARKANTPACVQCHGSHGVRSLKDSASPTYFANLPGACGSCHEEAFKAYRDGVHGKAVLARLQSGSATCISCHSAHGVVGRDVPGSLVSRARVAETCGRCHVEANVAFKRSVHGVAVRRGDPHAATCVDCHSSHAIRAPAEPQSPTSKMRLAGETCGRCHGALRLTEMHRLPVQVVADFRGSFHGLAGALGDQRVANCASCHGYHEIRLSRDPLSSVNSANLARTCGQCHPGAGPGFARGGIHHLPRTFGHRLVDLVRTMYRMMIGVVVGLMVLHNGLDFRQRWRERLARRQSVEKNPDSAGAVSYLRFTLNERVQHWVLAGSFIMLVLTGFALKFRWSLPFMDGQIWPTLRALEHRGTALTFISLAVYHVGYLVFTERGRGLIRAMAPRFSRLRDLVCCAGACLRLGPPSLSDWRDLVQMVKYNLGLTDRRPQFGRFNYAEKMEYLALVWGSGVMVASGLILWFEEPFLNRFPYWGIELATVVHYYEAILATMAIVVWHFYFTIINPDVFPMSKTMITGKLSREEMENDHPLDLRRMLELGNATAQEQQSLEEHR